MRSRRWISGLAAVLLLTSSAAAGYLGGAWRLAEGPRLTGWLTATAFSAACQTPEDRARALLSWAQERTSRSLLGSLISPAMADTTACRIIATRDAHNLVVTAGKTNIRDCLGGTGTPVCTNTQLFKFHGIGTGTLAPAAGDTGCQTELTTQYNPDNTRATGTQTNNGATVYRTVGTNTVDAAVAATEWCLLTQAATLGGTMLSRVTFTVINLASGDSLQTTYDLTLN